MSGVGQFSFSTPSAEGPPPDSDQIQPEWWAIPKDGSPAFVLEDATGGDIADIAGMRGAISVSVPLGTTTHDLLYAHTVEADDDLEVEIRLFGGANQALRGLLQECDGDDVAETGSRKWSGCLLDGLLYEWRLPPNPDDPKGEWHFAGKNAAQMILTLVQLAHGESALPGVTTATFSSAVDSLGNSWTGLATTVSLSVGQTLGEILDDFLEQGLCERDMSRSRELRLYVPGTRGIDRTVGEQGVPPMVFGSQPFGTSPFGGDPGAPGGGLVVLQRGRDLTDAPRKWSVRDAVTDILVAGKDGLYQTASDPSARARRGRKIVGYASGGQVTDQAALQAYAQNKLATLTPGAVELSHGLVVNGEGPQPFIDVNVGDWVWSDTGNPAGPEKLRVQQVALSYTEKEIKAVAVVGTLSMSAVVLIARRVARLERGTTVVGTSVDTSTGGGDDLIPPAAPTGLVASSIAYQDVTNGETLARIDLGWQAVTTDAVEAVAAQAQAAQLILDRIESGAPIFEDWTWTGAPALVGTYNDSLVSAFEAAGEPESTDLPAAKTWLQAYILDAEAAVTDPVVTDDVAGYRVRYAYVGANQIGGIPSSDPFLDENTLAYYVATDDTGTTATSFSWGGVGAGREVRLQVQAFDRSGNPSTWSAPLVITTASDNLPPAVTSTPTIETLFAGVRIFWDGLTTDGILARTAAPDFDHVEVHLSQALDFTPDATTYQHILNDAGVWTVQGLEYGVGYFARLVAVDTAGNTSAPSASAGPATPGKIVNIDIGPDAISRVQIIDGEIVTAKIADLAVNDAKIAALSVGKLTAGIMTADVIIGGSFMTAQTGQRMRIDSAGWQAYNSLNQVFAKLDIPNSTIMVTGTYQSGLTGERVNILPDGTLRLYPVAGNNFMQLSNFGNDMVLRGPLDAAGRGGRFNTNVTGCGMNFSAETEIPNQLRSEVVLFDRYVRITAPKIQFQVNGKLSHPQGERRQVLFSHTNASGTEIAESFLYYRMAGSGGGGWYGNDAGIKFEGSLVHVTTGEDMNGFGTIQAADYFTYSSREVKTDIVPIVDRLAGRAVDTVRQFDVVGFRYKPGYDATGRRHIGLIVEEVAPLVPDLVTGVDGPVHERALSPIGVAALTCAAVRDLADDRDALIARVEALEARFAA